MRTKLLAAALGVALTSCWGEGGRFRDPSGTAFHYGAEETPTVAEASAASLAATAAVKTTGLAGEAGTSSAPDGAHDEATISMTTVDVLPGGAAFTSSAELSQERSAQLATALLHRGLAEDWSQDCWTATASQIALDDCQLPIDDSGTWTLTGSLTLSGRLDLSTDLATWDATVDVRLGDDTPFNATGYEALNGSIAWTDTTLSGHSRVDISLDVFSYGLGAPAGGAQGWHEWHGFWRGVTYDTDYDLTYAPASVCAARVTGGTITVKRLWSTLPPWATGDAFTSASIRFTWSGCGDVSTNLTVARSWEEI